MDTAAGEEAEVDMEVVAEEEVTLLVVAEDTLVAEVEEDILEVAGAILEEEGIPLEVAAVIRVEVGELLEEAVDTSVAEEADTRVVVETAGVVPQPVCGRRLAQVQVFAPQTVHGRLR